MFFRTKYLKYIFSFIICTFAAFMIIRSEFALAPISDKAVSELQREYSQLTIMPGSNLWQTETLHKSTAVTFLYVYYTNQSSDEIKKHYQEEAKKNQWILQNEHEGASLYSKGSYQLYVVHKTPSNIGRYHISLCWPPNMR